MRAVVLIVLAFAPCLALADFTRRCAACVDDTARLHACERSGHVRIGEPHFEALARFERSCGLTTRWTATPTFPRFS